MRVLRFVPLALLPFCASVLAADLPEQVQYDAPPAADWSGFYVGAHAGYLFGSVDSDIPSLPFSYSTDPEDFAGGVFVGYQHQEGQIVFGIEGDLGFTSAKDSFTDGITFATDEFDWTGSVRGRVGLAFDRLMPFVTGGLAVAGVESTDDLVGGGEFQSIDKTMVGFVIGGGVEAMISEQFIARVEVLYSDYGSKTFSFNEPLFVTEKDYSATVVRGGLAWRF